MKDSRFHCQINAKAESDEAEILIYDDIGASWFGDGITAKQFVKDLAELDAALLTVRINSSGGDVFEGLAIHNAIKRHDAMVVVEIDALAASIASIIALAGDEVRMADNAFFMIHDPSGLEWGTAEDMRAMAELLDKVGGSLANVYAEKTGKDMAEVVAWMSAETWFDADEALEAGFVDAVTKGKKMAARADLSAFSNTPKALRAALTAEDIPPTAGGAAPDDSPAPNQPAPEAKGDTVDNNTAAQSAGAGTQDAIKADRLRAKQIRAIAKTHSIDAALADGWIDEGLSVDQVNANVLEAIRAKAATSPAVNSRVGAPRADNDPRRGFEGHRDFIMAVIDNSGAMSRDQVQDERLRPLMQRDDEDKQAGGYPAYLLPRAFNPGSIRAAAGSDEHGTYADPYGGFAVPTTTLPGLLSIPFEGDPTAGRTQPLPMESPQVDITARVDKDHSTCVSGGLTVARRAETAAIVASRMAMEKISLKAHSLFGAAYETEELMTDSPISFVALIASGFSDQFQAHILNEKIRGLGGNEFVGVLNADCKIQVAKESGQAADTIVSTNVIKMAARSWGFGQAIWLANHDTRPQLAVLSIAVGTAGTLIYQPSEREGFPDMLWGRPIFYTEYASTLGDAGDIILWNPTQYLEGLYQPLQSAESMHVRFLNHERVFKFWLRNCGAPWWRSALTPANGSTLSPIVTLAARA